jgi:cytoskeletal protein CcmA (bactofilin family)
MVFSRKHPKPQTRIDCLIGAGTKVVGDITFSGGLRVDGEVLGNVRSLDDQPGTLVISEHARIEGEVHVPHVVINGAVVGPVFSSSFLELQPKARVSGDASYNAIEIHLGAVIQGRLNHQDGAAKAVELKLAANR